MEVTSSTDMCPVQELAADLTLKICDAQIQLEAIMADVKDLIGTFKYFSEQANLVHLHGHEDRREDILCFLVISDSSTNLLRGIATQLEQLKKEVDDNLNC